MMGKYVGNLVYYKIYKCVGRGLVIILDSCFLLVKIMLLEVEFKFEFMGKYEEFVVVDYIFCICVFGDGLEY